MFEFRVANMNCGHCVSTITKAVKRVDPQATVEIDLPSKLVKVESAADAGEFQDAIADAGFSAEQQK